MPGWKLLSSKIDCCTSTKCITHLRHVYNNADFNRVKPHAGCVLYVIPCHELDHVTRWPWTRLNEQRKKFTAIEDPSYSHSSGGLK